MDRPNAYPSGTVTFLFSDIEGSTALWERDRPAMARAVDRHLALFRQAVAAHHGVLYKVVGDAVQAAFATAADALAAAVAAEQALVAADWGGLGPLRVRMALHAGAATPRNGDYLAPCLNRLARLSSIGHGQQILLSETVRRLLEGALPPDVSLRDLGQHRLRDLLEPERIWQVLAPGVPDVFPALRSLAFRPHNLPSPPTPLVGREDEVARLLHHFANDARLVTLTGPGGSGKTRLALEVAAELVENFPDGVWFLDLAALTDPDLLLPQVATVLGVREIGSQSLLEQIAVSLSRSRILLILDNLEQFRPFADLSRTVAALLTATTGLAVLATSRAPLRLRLERESPIPPLSVPSAESRSIAELAAAPAVRFFVARARAARPGFVLSPQNADAVAALCRRLDGLPLALELAAARVRALSPADILDRLGDRLDLLADRALDRPDRQRTLEATIGWSYDLLSWDEQAAFRRLAVCSGFTLSAAEAVLAAFPEPTQDAINTLERLIEQGLVHAEEQADGSLRYRLLETVRAFALERLRESGDEDPARRAHASHFATFGVNIEQDMMARLLPVMETLEPEADNLRSAMAYAAKGNDAETGLLLALAFGYLVWLRGQMAEGREWLERLLALDAPVADAPRAQALGLLGWLAFFQGVLDQAESAATQSLAIDSAAMQTRAGTLNLLACVAWDRGFATQARQHFEEALAVASRLPDAALWTAAILNNFGEMVEAIGDMREARGHYETALAMLPSDEAQFLRSSLLVNLASVAWKEGDAQRSATLLQEALPLSRSVRGSYYLAGDLDDTARHAFAIGEATTAARLLGAADRLRRRAGVPVEPPDAGEHQELLTGAQRLLGAAAFTEAWHQGETLSFDEAIDEADRILSEIASSGAITASEVESSAARTGAAEAP
jgi:predicted ATPase/class 3 adenylate cyclase